MTGMTQELADRLYADATKHAEDARARLADQLAKGYTFPTFMEDVAIAQFEVSWWADVARAPGDLEETRGYAFNTLADMRSDSASPWGRAEMHAKKVAAKNFYDATTPNGVMYLALTTGSAEGTGEA